MWVRITWGTYTKCKCRGPAPDPYNDLGILPSVYTQVFVVLVDISVEKIQPSALKSQGVLLSEPRGRSAQFLL